VSVLHYLHYLENQLTDGGKVVRIACRPRFAPQEYSWYSFLLEVAASPRPHCGWKGYVN
jgi:hypothetical protein